MMNSRREFLRVAGAAGAYAMTVGGPPRSEGQTARRQVTIGGRRVRVIDVHAHCVIPVPDVVKGTPLEKLGGGGGNNLLGPQRLQIMDQQGVDVQALTINGFWWYAADRDLARRIVQAQNEGLAKWVAAHPDRFVATGVGRAAASRSGGRAAARTASSGSACAAPRSAATSTARTCRCRSSTRSGPRPPSSACWCSCIPAAPRTSSRRARFRGRGDLGNIIGNPLETTYFLSRLIFDGTFDKFPGLRVCGAHAGGYLPSYLGRTEAACDVRGNANCANKKKPSEYLKSQILIDTMVFSEEGLRHLVAEVGVGQVVYGTDVPFNWPVTVDLVLNATFLSDAEKEAILSGNLRKLLRIGA